VLYQLSYSGGRTIVGVLGHAGRGVAGLGCAFALDDFGTGELGLNGRIVSVSDADLEIIR